MEQENLWLFSVENAIELIFVFDSEGMITYANASAKRSLDYLEGMRGIYVNDIFPNFSKDVDLKNVTALGYEVDTKDMMAYRKNRTCFPVKAKIEKCSEYPVLYVCMAFDTSEQTFLEKRVAQVTQDAETALKVKSEFVANVTHELRTPVNGLLGNTRELLSKENEHDKRTVLRMMERGCQDMHALINNILDFSKLEAGKFTLEMRKFDFREMIDYVKSNHQNKIIEKGLDFFVTISPEVPQFIIGDELRIVQILNNLLSNACKFTSVGKINVEVLKTAQVNNRAELFFIVLDSGIGIDKADQDKLFKSFSQVDASISRRYGGTGLGLNICKQLVELMDGNIRVEGERNKGSMFSFSIWVELPQEELKEPTENVDVYTAKQRLLSFQEMNQEQKLCKYGEAENIEEIKKQMSKLILCIEMENWEKAETFMEAVRQLTEEAPREVKTASLKLKMAVQKGDYDKTIAAFQLLESLVPPV